MKRSQINQAIKEAEQLMKKYSFYLPAFAKYTIEDWQNLDIKSTQEIFEAKLGWDVTDFNLGNFHKYGLTLFTIRNQSLHNNKPYAEKIMMVKEGQVTPMHYHRRKMEDIINRGGGTLVIQLYHRNEQTNELDHHRPMQISIDGQKRTLTAGSHIRLFNGQSICLPTQLYHSFWAEHGDVLVGEVSMANDDLNDNYFLKPLDRFSKIEEDEPIYRNLCSDY